MAATEVATGQPDVARVAALLGDRARARVLMTLTDGRALPASMLASEAGVAASTMSEHLTRLREAGLVTADRQGRTRYYRLAGPDVAQALEAIARIAPPQPVRSLREGTRAHAVRQARTCYDHLAGRLGVTLMAALLERSLLDGGDGHHQIGGTDRLAAPGHDVCYHVTARGRDALRDLGVDVDAVLARRGAVRYCLDWSEQRHHLAGRLGAALADRLFALGWLRRAAHPRAVRLTACGLDGLHTTLGLPLDWSG